MKYKRVDLEAILRELERTDPKVKEAAKQLAELPEYFARTKRWKAARTKVRGEGWDK